MNISDAIRQLALRGCEMYLTVCTVDAVDEEARTIDCTPIDEGAQLVGVNLQADQNRKTGIVVIPTVGSDVVVGFINPAVAVMILTTDVKKTILVTGNTELIVEDNNVTLTTAKVNAHLTGEQLRLDANGTTLEIDSNGAVYNSGVETTANATILQQELVKMSARIDGIIQAITTSGVGTSDGGALYKTNMTGIVSALVKEDFSGIIDDKIKH